LPSASLSADRRPTNAGTVVGVAACARREEDEDEVDDDDGTPAPLLPPTAT
jgi:hypothetical protein